MLAELRGNHRQTIDCARAPLSTLSNRTLHDAGQIQSPDLPNRTFDQLQNNLPWLRSLTLSAWKQPNNHAQEIRQEVATRLDEQQERWTELAATVETIRADSKAAQETVMAMATNVVKWIHKIQNLLVATENTQSERLQEVEQKLIHLQAAFETLENQRKPRKWFSMPASLTSIMLTVGASGLAILAQVIWTID